MTLYRLAVRASITAPYCTLSKPSPDQSAARFVGRFASLLGPKDFGSPTAMGRITADLTTGEHRWMVPVGDSPLPSGTTEAQSAAVGLAVRITLVTKSCSLPEGGREEGKQHHRDVG